MNPKFVESFCQLGRLNKVPEEFFMSLCTFFCLLYGDLTSTTFDECRYHLFNLGKYSDDCLPPNDDSVCQHVKRANFQLLA